MKAVRQIIDDIGGVTAVARMLGVGPSTVSEMKRKGRIMSEYWVELVIGAHAKGHYWLTHEYLSQVHARAAGRPLLEGAAPVPAEVAKPGAGPAKAA